MQRANSATNRFPTMALDLVLHPAPGMCTLSDKSWGIAPNGTRLLNALLMTFAILGGFPTTAPAQPAAQTTYDQWVRQLGNPSFRLRESAERRLTQAGMAAKPALLRGLKNPDLEIRMGANRLLTQVLQEDFNRKLTRFVDDKDPKVAAELPAWDRFSKWLGNDRTKRQLFVDMLRAELFLLTNLARDADTFELQSAVARRLKELMAARRPDGSRARVSTVSMATLLFVTAQPELKMDSIIESQISSLLGQPTLKHRVLAGPRAATMKQLLDRWIAHAGEHRQSYYALRLTLSFDRKQLGVKLARATLQDTATTASILPYAAIAMARFGQRADARFLLPHLENTTVCHTWSNPQLKKEPIRIEVRDIVLAMLIHMSGQDPKDFGFKLLAPDPETFYRIYTFGFLSDQERAKALKKWRNWSSKNTAWLTAATPPAGTIPAAPGAVER